MIDTTTAFHLLLEGKILRSSEGTLFRIHDGKLTISFNDGLDWHMSTELNDIEEVLEEFPFTFAQAFRMMQEGKTMMHEGCGEYAYRFRDGRFESSCSDDEFTEWKMCGVSSIMQTDMWKVVE